MKTTRKIENQSNSGYEFSYNDFPGEGQKNARITEWESGEGYDVYLGEDKIELTSQ